MSRQTTVLSFDDMRRDAQLRGSSDRIVTDRAQRLKDLPSFESSLRQPIEQSSSPVPSGSSRSFASSSSGKKRQKKTAQSSANSSSRVRKVRVASVERFQNFVEEERSSSQESSQAKSAKSTPFYEKMKKSFRRNKADKAFAKQFGDAGKNPGASQVAPRAAVYKGEMGSKHRQAVRMQQAQGFSPAKKFKSSSSSILAGKTFSTLVVCASVAACLLFACVFLYPTAQLFYQELREYDRLEAEYAAIVERNDSLESSVALLQTDTGIEIAAYENYGWVYEGDITGTVVGLDIDESEDDFVARIVSGSVEAPDTWYSVILDPLFGVE